MHSTSNQPPQKIEIRIPADARHVRVVRLAAAGVASELEFSIDDIEDIKLAVAEACNNAILHARLPQDGGRLPVVIIALCPSAEQLEICIEDEGALPATGWKSPRQKTSKSASDHKDEALPDGVLPEGGLGLLIIESLMDEVGHQPGTRANTVLRMVKYTRAARANSGKA